MFDISALKEMKLSELQQIAKAAKTIKYNGVKKDALITSILDFQNSLATTAVEENPAIADTDDKPKRQRIAPAKKPAIVKNKANAAARNEDENKESQSAQPDLPVAADEKEVVKEQKEVTKQETVAEKAKTVKFNKATGKAFTLKGTVSKKR